MLTKIFTVLSLLGLSSCCQAVHDQTDQNTVLASMAQPLGPSRRIVQQVTTDSFGHQQSLLVILELDDQQIAMSGISNEGLSLFNLRYDGKSVSYDKSLLAPEAVSPVEIIFDLQLAYWPVAMLQPMLADGMRISADENKRFVFNNNEKQLEINFLEPNPDWPKMIELVNFRNNYRLLIKTISYDLIPE